MFQTIARIHQESMMAAKERMAARRIALKKVRAVRAEREIQQFCTNENWLEEVRWAR